MEVSGIESVRLVIAIVGGCIAAAMLMRPGQTDDEKKGTAFLGFIVGVVIYILINAIIVIFIVVTMYFAICKFGPTFARWALTFRGDVEQILRDPRMPEVFRQDGIPAIEGGVRPQGLPAPAEQAFHEMITYIRQEVEDIDQDIVLLQQSDDHDPADIQQEIMNLLVQKQDLLDRLYRFHQGEGENHD